MRTTAVRTKERRWTIPRADLALGAADLVRLEHAALPAFDASRLLTNELVLLPDVPRPRTFADRLTEAERLALLVRGLGLFAFLASRGLGPSPEDLTELGAHPRDPLRPWLAGPPVPSWRAVSPALATAVTALRLRGEALAGSDREGLRRGVEAALRSGRGGDGLTRAALTALHADESSRQAEALLAELVTLLPEPPPGSDFLGLATPIVFEDEADVGPFMTTRAGLFAARGFIRREARERTFAEVPGGERLKSGSGLLRVAAALGADPLADGPPASLALLDAEDWDRESRTALAEASSRRLVVVEVRRRERAPWDPAPVLRPRLSAPLIQDLVYFPLVSLGDSPRMAEALARASGGDLGRLLAAARRLAQHVVPGGTLGTGPIRLAMRPPVDAILSAAALLPRRFTAAVLVLASGRGDAEVGSSLSRAVEDGRLALAETGPSAAYTFVDEALARALREKVSPAEVGDVARRLREGAAPPEVVALALLSRGLPEDVLEARRAMRTAAANGQRPMIRDLLARAPKDDPALGAPLVAVRVLFEADLLSEARRLAGSLTGGTRSGSEDPEPVATRIAAASCLARLDLVELALSLVPEDGEAVERLGRVGVLLRAHREREAEDLLRRLDPRELPGTKERAQHGIFLAEVLGRRREDGQARLELARALERLDVEPDAALRYQAAQTAGFLASDLERLEDAFVLFRKAREAATTAEEQAEASVDLGVCLFHAGRYAEAEREYDRAASMYEALGDEDSYVSVLGNRADLLVAIGDHPSARRDLARVMAHDRRPDRGHQLLFAVPTAQRLALREGDLAAAADAYAMAGSSPGAATRFLEHSARREVLILEAARLLASREPAAARPLLVEAGRLPDNRQATEPLRRQLLASVSVDLREPPSPAAPDDELHAAERRLRRGEPLAEGSLQALRAGLASGASAGALGERLVSWLHRFGGDVLGSEVLSIGLRAARTTGLMGAASRFEAALAGLETASAGGPVPREARAPAHAPLSGAVAEDDSTRKVFEDAARVASSRVAVLILGETGTGKEVVARRVHDLSGRAGPFVAVNTAALSSTLVESELFGHRKGAFTGADRDRVGLVEASSGGTLLLDEIGDLPLPLQAKLLRVLQEQEVVRVGETRPRAVDLRVVSATHRDLRRMTEEGTFRPDLYHRLAGFTLTLRPLRERPRDLGALLARLLDGRAISPDARSRLLAHDWPGNVRELHAAVETAGTLAAGARIEVGDLPEVLRRAAAPVTLHDQRLEADRRMVEAALAACDGNRTKAAKRLGISRQALHAKLKRYRL